MREGKLTVIAGPMFAGKTEALIAQVEAAERRNLDVIVFKPTLDTRHEEAEVVSHDGRRCRAFWLQPELFVLPSSANLIAIDEAQFLLPESVPAVLDAIRLGVHVVLAGLDLTWKGDPFGPLPTFMAFADEVVKLRGRCASCGKPASRSYRLVQCEETVLVGGAEAYEPRCLSCFQPSG